MFVVPTDETKQIIMQPISMHMLKKKKKKVNVFGCLEQSCWAFEDNQWPLGFEREFNLFRGGIM